MPVIECVPNVSEGRSPRDVDAMADAVAAVRGVHLLDRSSDPSHNRSVLTLAGDSAGLLRAGVTALFERAIAAIDLRVQRGVHPRIGAVDVVPFVPIAGVSMPECVALARTVAETIASRFSIPVYLYGEASATAARARLENIRRGGFEGLAARMAEPGWAPDFGPASPHPSAGASAVGARRILIAFNINLDTDTGGRRRDRSRGAFAKAVEALPHVKALGLALSGEGRAQVSMNLTNYEATPIERVFDAVAAYAARVGRENHRERAGWIDPGSRHGAHHAQPT